MGNQDRAQSRIISFGIALVFLALWEGMVRFLGLPPYLLPSPSHAGFVFFKDPAYYLTALGVTLSEATLGLIGGFTIAFLIATLISAFPAAEDGVMTLAILVKSSPLVAIAPLLTIWLGFGWLPKVIITGLLTFFPVLINIIVGFESGSKELYDLLNVLKANPWQVFWKLKVLLALPFIFAALRVAAPLALVGAVVAEWAGASGGLGRIMWMAYANLNLPPMFAAIMLLSGSGMAIYTLIVSIEKKVIRWQVAQLS